MSYTSIPNQPIIFNSQLPQVCEGCGSEFAQLADFNDQLFWQLEAGECGHLRLRDTQTVAATIDGSNVVFPDNGNNPAYAVFTYDKFVNCLDYRVSITIATGATGTLIIGFLNGSFIEVSAPGTHEIYIKENDIPVVVNGPQVPLLIAAKAGDKFVGTVTLNEFTAFCNGALFAGIVDAQDLSVVQVLNPTITTKDQFLTAAIALSDYDLDAGCYRLAIADYCTNTCGQYYIYNPYFNNWGLCIDCPPVGWYSNSAIGSDVWTVGDGSASLSYTSNANITYLNNTETVLCADKEYSVTLIVDSIVDGSLRVIVDNVAEGTLITSAGTYTFNITPASTGEIGLFLINDIGQTAEVKVSKFDVRAYKEWATYDLYSDLIQIGDFSDDCRFFKIEGCNGENQFGMAFYGTSFLPGIRLEGRRFQPQYDTDSDLFRYASGRWQASYVDRKKKLSYHFGRLPEYVLDFLSLVFYFDNCYVNGQVVFPADNEFPTIEYDNADDLGSLTIDLYKKNDKVRKTVCIGVDADCLPSILDNDSEPFILTQDGERITTQDLVNLYQE
jgi:hypothetical protein